MIPDHEQLFEVYARVLKSTFENASKVERQQAVVAFARAIGFTNARCAVWDCDSDGEPSCFESPQEELVNSHTPPVDGEHDLGIYLYDTVYTGVVPNPQDEDEPLGETFDTREERDAWMATHAARGAGK